MPDNLARAMDAHLQSTGLCPEDRVEKEPSQQFVQMIHRPAHDVQWSFADPLFWNTKKPRTTTVYTERSAEEYREARHLCFQSPFNQPSDFVQSLSGGDEENQSLSGEDVDDDSEDDMMELLPTCEESGEEEDGDSNGFSSGEN